MTKTKNEIKIKLKNDKELQNHNKITYTNVLKSKL